MLLIMLTLGLAVLAFAGLVVATGALTAWRRERQRSRRLADQLFAEAHLEWLTGQTLQAMRRVARQTYRGSQS
jgi:hypothetical protein